MNPILRSGDNSVNNINTTDFKSGVPLSKCFKHRYFVLVPVIQFPIKIKVFIFQVVVYSFP